MRPIIDILRESLGSKTLLKFFSNPADPADPKGNVAKLTEFVDISLWWLGEGFPVEIEDTSTFVIPSDGVLDLGVGPGQQVRKIIRVVQNGDVYPEIRQDWSEGTPAFAGAWVVKNRRFYALSIVDHAKIPGILPFRNAHLLRVGRFSLSAGAVEFTYLGIPTEAQLSNNTILLQAAIDYSMYLVYQDMIVRILRPINLKLEGVPDVRHNVADYRAEANIRLKKAMNTLNLTEVQAR